MNPGHNGKSSADRWPLFHRMALALCLGLGLVVSGSLGLAIQRGLVFETDLQALLPRHQDNELAQRAGQRLFDYGGDKILLLIAAPDTAAVSAAAAQAEQLLRQIPLLQVDSMAQRAEQSAAQLAQLLPYRFQLLSGEQLRALERGDGPKLAQHALRELYQPRGWSRSTDLLQDPLNLLQGFYAASQTTPRGGELVGDQLILQTADQPQRRFALLSARTRDSALDLDAQQSVVQAIDDVERALRKANPEVDVLRSGIVFHAAAAARQARGEIATIGIGSGLGIIALFIATFASLRPLLLSLSSVLFGSVVALALCHYLFGSIHLLTLVFGAALIGVAIDYSLHFFTRLHGAGEDGSPRDTLRAIFPGILLGLVTSLIGYGSLAQAPLPGLRQIAAFSVTGLASAWLFVVALYPLASKPVVRRYPAALLALADAPWRMWRGWRSRRAATVLGALGLASIGYAWLALATGDDARSLYRPSADLLAQERQIQALAGNYSANQFFLLQAADEQALLQLEERAHGSFQQLVAAGAISQWNGVSRQLPSVARQQRNYRAQAQHVYGPEGAAWPLLAQLEVDAPSLRALRDAFDDHRAQYLLPESWLAGASEEARLLWFTSASGAPATMVTLQGVKDLDALAAAARGIEGMEFIDRVALISAVLAAQRHSASLLLALAYGCVMVLLLWRYRNPRALLLVLAPLVSSSCSLAMLALAGISLTLFHVFALFLVLGLGMDYGIFARESGPGDEDCRLAIVLSAVTSCLSFGLLALSSTPMVQAFGLTVLLGSAFNLLLVPLVATLAGRPAHD